MLSLRGSWVIVLAFCLGCSGGGEPAGNDSAASSGLAESKSPESSRADEVDLTALQAAMDADPDNPRTIRPLGTRPTGTHCGLKIKMSAAINTG